MRRIPIAWLSLTHDRRRLAASLAGVTFAVLLMFIEMGFLNGVFDSQTSLVEVLEADLFIINRQKEDVLPATPFSRRRLEQARVVAGVADVNPLYLEEFRAVYKSFTPERRGGVAVLGFRPEDPPFSLADIKRQADRLRLPDTALADENSRDLFGRLEEGVSAELNGRKVSLIGTFNLGPNFRTDCLLLMSDQNFFRYFPDPATGIPNPDRVEIGLIRLKRGFEKGAVKDALMRHLPSDVVVLDRTGFIERIKKFWRDLQPIGAVFGLGAAVGFLIGVAVCYQILYTDITDNIAQYATLKALGSHNSFLVGLVTRKAILLALGGFVCGLLLSGAIYDSLQTLSGIKMSLTIDRAVMVLMLSLLMCVISGLFAVRRALRLDPAELF